VLPQARDKQMARLAREERLAALTMQLGNGKRVRVGDLQGKSRVVIVAGTQQQVGTAAKLQEGRCIIA
jgi:uncharacterized protein YigA (DUF484 family)